MSQGGKGILTPYELVDIIGQLTGDTKFLL
jgi:hypothetical protein